LLAGYDKPISQLALPSGRPPGAIYKGAQGLLRLNPALNGLQMFSHQVFHRLKLHIYLLDLNERGHYDVQPLYSFF
jgi:hypothetical protein